MDNEVQSLCSKLNCPPAGGAQGRLPVPVPERPLPEEVQDAVGAEGAQEDLAQGARIAGPGTQFN